ncbi:MAG: hypothetical protein AAGB46_20445 [Verrucomicrobiota bacterium]
MAESDSSLEIPVEFYPKIVEVAGEEGEEATYRKANASGVLHAKPGETAVILIDTWNGVGGADPLTPLRKRQKEFLEFCREVGITVIHAPNMPAAKNYPQYFEIKEKVSSMVEGYDVRPKNPPPFMELPKKNSEVYDQGRALRQSARVKDAFMPPTNLDISKHLKPLDSEYVLTSYMELRYVIWKEEIGCILYMGEYLNECVQQRETGINRLAGTDKWRVPLALVVLKDLVAFEETEDVEAALGSKVMLDYFKRKIAFVSRGKGIMKSFREQP